MCEAEYWHRDDNGKICCDLCPHGCHLDEGQAGICRVRRVRNGRLVAEGYGQLAAEHLDPIEKKPLYHFYPGSWIYSIGGWGCNLSCRFCQNWTISQRVMRGGSVTPAEIVARAEQVGSIAYTYNEPLVSFEFVRDCARLAHAVGLRNVVVTNGYIAQEPAAELLPLIDALNIDIKSMDDTFYRRLCGGRLQPVLDFVQQSVASGAHVELTNLLIPGENDTDEDIEALARWVAHHAGKTMPLHISAYFPNYKSRIPPTSREQVLNACRIARRFLENVHPGNI